MSQTDSTDVDDFFLPKALDPAIELKGSVFTLTVLRLQSLDLDAVEIQLKERLAQGPRFFENAPVVLDLEPLKENAGELAWDGLIEMLRSLRLVPVGVRHATQQQQYAALNAGMAVMKGGAIQSPPAAATTPPRRTDRKSTKPARGVTETETAVPTVRKTKLLDQPVRSGQQVYAENTDLILLAPVNAGAEIIADGHIHVYAPLRGRALAGVKGDTSARIFCQFMEAELVAIAGHYQIYEEKVPDNVYREAVQVYLDGERLFVSPLTRRQRDSHKRHQPQ